MGSYAGQRRRTPPTSGWIKFALLGVVISIFFQGALCEVEPTESQCRPYIEKALKEQQLEEGNVEEIITKDTASDQEENPPIDEITDPTDSLISKQEQDEGNDDNDDGDTEVEKDEDNDDDDDENKPEENAENDENEDQDDEDAGKQVDDEDDEKDEVDEELKEGKADEAEDDEDDNDNKNDQEDQENEKDADESDKTGEEEEDTEDEENLEKADDDDYGNLERPIEIEVQEVEIGEEDDQEEKEADKDEKEDEDTEDRAVDAQTKDDEEDNEDDKVKDDEHDEDDEKDEKDNELDKGDEKEEAEDDHNEVDEKDEKDEDKDDDGQQEKTIDDDEDDKADEKAEDEDDGEDKKEEDDTEDDKADQEVEGEDEKGDDEKRDDDNETDEKDDEKDDDKVEDTDDDRDDDKVEGTDEDKDETESADVKYETYRVGKREVEKSETEGTAESEDAEDSKDDDDRDQETPEEEELIKEVVIPDNLRPRDHISKILKLEESEMETTLEKAIDSTLKSLKGLYDSAIKPLEMLYKYRDLSNRHFGDPEIFSKPLILFMGPWSGGKSSTINYLLDNEFSQTSLRTGAEPSPAYFNILMHGEEEEILDGTQLAADWTFSGLQKFGQSLLDRLRGIKLPNKLLEKVNIVEIPGILEIRKQVQRLFPFNDACQWFIDRADIIFLVYDPSKLDVGPETEAILDQLKGREYQTRIILNKADQVKPEELMRVQGTLIWNISPLMSSSEPPIMYSTSLWSMPYEAGAPTRLLLAQERAFLRDLREAIEKRVENKIASARRFAVRVRNHAKMVDCYLTTYYNHKSFFGNRKKISDDIIEYPQKYHIYEGLSTLTNISRYDLPDPDVYRDFFKINPLYDFKKLSETCTYFRGCPINKLDVAIAYDLPELVGKYKKAIEASKEQPQKENS